MYKRTHFIGEIGETLQIAGNIRITILDIRGDEVRLGVKAPPDVAVLPEPPVVPLFSS